MASEEIEKSNAQKLDHQMMEPPRVDFQVEVTQMVESQLVVPQVVVPQGSLSNEEGDNVVSDAPPNRMSDWLKKDTSLSTMEKNVRMAPKRNLEGNSTIANTFSVLTTEEIIHITTDMGIIYKDDFVTYDLLKDIEKARDDLCHKQIAKNQNSQTMVVEKCQSENEPLLLEWLQGESSDSEDFILVESRKKKRERKKSVKISPSSKGKTQDQEGLDLPKKRGRKPKDFSSKKSNFNKK